MHKKIGERVIWKRVHDFLAVYKPLIIGVTGSAGKSITRDAIALALSPDRRVRASTHSFNTPLDVALSILGIDHLSSQSSWFQLLTRSLVKELKVDEPDALVLELGADRPGYIDFLAQQLPITIGVVTTVGTTHTELFTSKEMVAHEKMSLVVSLPRDGYAILNIDDPLVAAMAEHTKARVVWYGENPKADVCVVRLERLGDASLAAEVQIGNESYELHLPHVVARHHVTKILAALACAQVLELDLKQVAQRLQGFTPPPGRMRKLVGRHGSVLIDDSYTASPESMAAALDTLKAFSAQRRVAILGDITGLGGLAQAAHAAIGERAAKVANVVIVVGEAMREAGKHAMKAGADVHHFSHSDEVGKWFADFMQGSDVVLVCGSRDMHMEVVARRLLADSEQDHSKLV